MKRVLLAAILLAATAGTASAGGFVGLGIGGSPGVSSDSHMEADGRTGRIEGGYSFGRFAIEGLGQRFDAYNTSDFSGYTNTTLGIAGLFRLPLTDGFGVYGRAGFQHTSLSVDDDSAYMRSDQHYNGTGLLFGGGADFRLPIAAANLSLFVDYTIATTNLTIDELPQVAPYRFTTRSWLLGAKLAF